MQVYHCLFGWVDETPAFTRCGQCERRRCFENPPTEEEHRQRIRGLFQIRQDIKEPFRSPIDDSIISNRREKMEHCKKHGVVEYEPSLKKRKMNDA